MTRHEEIQTNIKLLDEAIERDKNLISGKKMDTNSMTRLLKKRHELMLEFLFYNTIGE